MVRVKSYPHHALTFTPTPVMPMNKGIEPMGESVRVKTAITFICILKLRKECNLLEMSIG